MMIELSETHVEALVEALNVYMMVKSNNLSALYPHLGDGSMEGHAAYYLLQSLSCLVVAGTPGSRISVVEQSENARIAADLKNVLQGTTGAMRLSSAPPPRIVNDTLPHSLADLAQSLAHGSFGR